MNNTSIDTLKDNLSHIEFNNDLELTNENILDLSLESDVRLKLFQKYYSINGDNTIELISQISGMYQFSGAKVLENYLYDIISKTNISSFLKIECINGLLSFSEYEERINSKDSEELKQSKIDSNNKLKIRNDNRTTKIFSTLNSIYDNLDKGLTTPYRINAVLMIMSRKEFRDDANRYFLQIINDKNIECDYRYKTILSLKSKEILDYEFYTINACTLFMESPHNKLMYRILAGQYLFQQKDLQNKDYIEHILLGFAQDETIEYNLRADAADTLLNSASEEMKLQARHVINKLGHVDGKKDTIFNNAQNVHMDSIEKSVLDVLDVLSTYSNDANTTVEDIYEIIEYAGSHNENILNSINRIKMDRTIYKTFTLSSVLVKIWSYMQQSDYKDEMFQRLIEELDEMAGTCSSGFLSRLVNVLSGFGELNIQISWDEQIIANLSGRLNAFARNITNESSPFFHEKLNDVLELYLNKHFPESEKDEYNEQFQRRKIEERIREFLSENREEKIMTCVDEFSENVLNEMMITSSNFDQRQNFLLFFRTYISQIQTELSREFSDFVTDSEFDLAFRKAISMYEEASKY